MNPWLIWRLSDLQTIPNQGLTFFLWKANRWIWLFGKQHDIHHMFHRKNTAQMDSPWNPQWMHPLGIRWPGGPRGRRWGRRLGCGVGPKRQPRAALSGPVFGRGGRGLTDGRCPGGAVIAGCFFCVKPLDIQRTTSNHRWWLLRI